MECPSEDSLLRYTDGLAQSAERNTIADHCAQCSSCRRAVALLIRAGRAASADESSQDGSAGSAGSAGGAGGADGRAEPISAISQVTPDPNVVRAQPVSAGHLAVASALATTVTTESIPQRDRQSPKSVAKVPAPSSERLPNGAQVGRYIVLRPLGAGGAGIVYLGYDPELDRKLALKLLRPDTGFGEAAGHAQGRLLREAQAAARLSHPNVVTVYDFGTHGDSVFVAMELVEGQSLADKIKHGPLHWRDALDLMLAAGRGLVAAHDAGIIHRDIKPSNILVDNGGKVRISDFGLARINVAEEVTDNNNAADNAGNNSMAGTGQLGDKPQLTVLAHVGHALTRTGTVLGTPAYMSPEQFHGMAVGAKSDQFSFCVSLYQAMYGHLPFAGDSFHALAIAVTTGERAAKPSGSAEARRHKSIPSWLSRILDRGLATDPAQRFPNMRALLRALERRQAKRRRRQLLGAGMMAALVVMAAALGALGYRALAHEQGTSALCRGGERKLEGVWDRDVRERIQTAFAKTELSHNEDAWISVKKYLDNYTAAWTAMYTSACEATHVYGEQSPITLDARMYCLDQRVAELSVLVKQYSFADADTVTNAVQMMLALPAIEDCAAVPLEDSRIAPPDLAIRPVVNDARGQLADAKIHAYAGRYDRAAELAEAAGSVAETLDYWPLLAEAKYRRAAIALKARQNAAEAEKHLFDALWWAEASRHDELAADIWLALLQVIVLRETNYEQGVEWSERASAAIARLGGDWTRMGHLQRRLGWLAQRRNRNDDALTHFQRAVILGERAMHDDNAHPLFLADTVYALGSALTGLGRNQEAIDVREKSLALYQEHLGDDHPQVATVLQGLSNTAVGMNDFSRATEFGEQALDIAIRSLGADHARVARARFSLGRAYLFWQHFTQAEVHLSDAVRLLSQEYDADNPYLIATQAELSMAHAGAGNHDQALEVGRDAVERALKVTSSPDDELPGLVQLRLASAYVEAGDYADALPLLDRAGEDLLRIFGDEHGAVAEVAFIRGRAYLGLGKMAMAKQQFERQLQLIGDDVAMTDLRAADGKFLLAEILADYPPLADRARARELASEALYIYTHSARTGVHIRERVHAVQAWLSERWPDAAIQ